MGTSCEARRPNLPWIRDLIFVTVGSQMPFDRLIAAVDAWAMHHPEVEVLAQVGATQFSPSHLRTVNAYSPSEFADVCKASQLIIAHAGMGSILTALQHGKPIVVMPRKGILRETRNDHQVAAAKWLRTMTGVFFADDEATLPQTIDMAMVRAMTPEQLPAQASRELIQGISRFIDEPEGGRRP